MRDVPPIIAVVIEEIAHYQRPGYVTLIVSTLTGSMLLPLLLALFLFSDAHQRRQPVFMAVVLAVFIGLTQSIYSDYVVMNHLYHPLSSVQISEVIAINIIGQLSNFVVDVALLFRVVAVYPIQTTPKWKIAAILTLPVLFKIFRFSEWIIWSAITVQRGTMDIETKYIESPVQKHLAVARWVCTMLDNAYLTALFLWKLRGSFNENGSHSVSLDKPSSIQQRIQTVFWLSLSNFVLPVPLCVVEVILILVAPQSMAYVVLNSLVGFISIICVVFATVWRGVSKHTESGGITITAIQSAHPWNAHSSSNTMASRARRRGHTNTDHQLSKSEDWESAPGHYQLESKPVSDSPDSRVGLRPDWNVLVVA